MSAIQRATEDKEGRRRRRADKAAHKLCLESMLASFVQPTI